MITENKNLSFWIQRLALFLLLFFPLTPALAYQIRSMSVFLDTYATLMLSPLFILFTTFLIVIFLKTEKESDWLSLAFVLGLAFSLRLASLLIIDTRLSSDFLDTHKFALDILQGKTTANTSEYTYIPEATYLNMTGLSIAGLYKIFGASIITVKVFMATLSTLTTALIYKVAQIISADHRVGIVAAIMFAAWPSMVIYTGVPSSEHLAIFLIILISLLCLSFWRKTKTNGWLNSIGYYLFIGFLIGLVDWFRPVGLILMIAFIVADILYRRNSQRATRYFLEIVLLIGAYYLVSNASLAITEKMHGVELPSSSQRFGESFLIGFNMESLGSHNWDDYQTIKKAYKDSRGDYDKARQYLVSLALDRIKSNKNQLPNLLKVKFGRIWKNNDQLFELASVGSNDQELLSYIKIMDALIYAWVTILALLTTIITIRYRSPQAIFMMQLFILGLAIILEITEAQMRYRSILTPYLVILAAVGMERGYFLARQKLLQVRQI